MTHKPRFRRRYFYPYDVMAALETAGLSIFDLERAIATGEHQRPAGDRIARWITFTMVVDDATFTVIFEEPANPEDEPIRVVSMW